MRYGSVGEGNGMRYGSEGGIGKMRGWGLEKKGLGA